MKITVQLDNELRHNTLVRTTWLIKITITRAAAEKAKDNPNSISRLQKRKLQAGISPSPD